MTKTSILNPGTVSVKLRDSFSKELVQYTTMVQRVLSGETMLGSVIKMPTINTNDILNKYIVLGEQELKISGAKSHRAKSISSFTFKELLEIEMNSLEGKTF